MISAEIARKDWGKICEQLNRDLRGAMISVRLVQPDGRRKDVFTDVPLQTVVLDETTDPCNDQLEIVAGSSQEKSRRYRVVEPIRILLQEGQNGRYHAIEIQAESGHTVLSLHPGLRPVPQN